MDKEHLLIKGNANAHFESEGEALRQLIDKLRRLRRSLVLSILLNIAFGLSYAVAAYWSPSSPARLGLGRASHHPSTLWSPMLEDDAIEYQLEEPPVDYWTDDLFFGPPTWDSDWAWNDLMRSQNIRIEDDEAVRLKLVDPAPLPDNGHAAMFGVSHNLHCLRRIRQAMDPDFYYPNRTEKDRLVDEHHNRHCLESIRTSVMCHPDLTIMPMVWGTEAEHPLNLLPNAPRECINWRKLIEWGKPRVYTYPDIEKGMAEQGREIPF